MSGVSDHTMQTMLRIGINGTKFLGYQPTIDRKIPPDAPCYKDPEHAVNWARGYLTAKDEDRVLLNPRLWTQEMHDAWHQNIPNTQAAFDALRAVQSPKVK